MSVSASAVDGLVSGLDTTSIVNNLLAVDGAAQTKLKTQVSNANLKVTAYQSVNSKMAALQTAADALQAATAWSTYQATSTDASVAVSTDTDATAASLSFSVTALATGRVVASPELTVDSTGVLTAAGKSSLNLPSPGLDIVRSDGSYITINPSSGALSDVTDAVNKASTLGVRAVAIRVSDGVYRLQLTSSRTGETAGGFKVVAHDTGKAVSTADHPRVSPNYQANYATLSTAGGGWSTLTAAQDAAVNIGGIAVKSSSNTFTDLLPGTSTTVSKVGVSNTVTVARNPDTLATAVQGLVDAANAAIDDVALQSRAGSVGASGAVTGGGTLRADSNLRTLKSQIVSAVTAALPGGSSAATLGIQSTKDGKLTFAKDTFLTAYAANPVSVQKLISSVSTGTSTSAATDGVVERLRKVSVYAVGDVKANPSTASGVLTTAVTGVNSTISNLTNQISAWDTKLAAKKVRYQTYYSNLEVTLGKLKSQSTWLSGQLSSLSGSSS
ncbi:MAG: flagellar filament capping protein FliD [Janthinobacterium lividum]